MVIWHISVISFYRWDFNSVGIRLHDIGFATLEIEQIAQSVEFATNHKGGTGFGYIVLVDIVMREMAVDLHRHCSRRCYEILKRYVVEQVLGNGVVASVGGVIVATHRRTGKFFAHQHAGIRPDIITVAKGIGNGFPMGAVLISPEIKPSYGMLGTTFGGNHLACAAAIAVLDVMKEENLVENAREVGEYLMAELRKIPQIKEVRGLGLMIGMEFDYPVKDLRKALVMEKRVFTGASGTNVIRLLPPLCFTRALADEFLTRFKSLL